MAKRCKNTDEVTSFADTLNLHKVNTDIHLFRIGAFVVWLRLPGGGTGAKSAVSSSTAFNVRRILQGG